MQQVGIGNTGCIQKQDIVMGFKILFKFFPKINGNNFHLRCVHFYGNKVGYYQQLQERLGLKLWI